MVSQHEERRGDVSLVDPFDRTRIVQAATLREVFDAAFATFRENFLREDSEAWLRRAREHAAEVLKTVR